ncbi:sulfotransferase [Parasphingopyxis sp.]|uniref:sulfotransferase n=1 Tax=Parasphingopyxis sp. TaxID=1920299 RepID=UPI002636F8AC|nr:sulfotransferase [Parasphingopyxis sp.]
MALEDYGWLDRSIHRIAFGTKVPQDFLLDMEERRYGDHIARQEIVSPIFVTGLARAGTTLVLETLARHPQLATHRYRDMPFVISPIIWRDLSGRFQVAQEKKERAHKDGLEVNTDSAEAFEEVLWMRAFPDHFGKDGIKLWDTLPSAFVKDFRRHMQRVIVARDAKGSAQPRYLSKNNGNISRLPALKNAFPDARVVVPLRHPLDHARSLLKQHQLASQSHAESGFARSYVSDIGHFEFGDVHRPFLFEGMSEIVRDYSPDDYAYWLHYWIAAHRHLAGQSDIEIVDMERFTNERHIADLLARLELDPCADVVRSAQEQIRPIKRYDGSPDADAETVEAAMAIYEQMRNRKDCLL